DATAEHDEKSNIEQPMHGARSGFLSGGSIGHGGGFAVGQRPPEDTGERQCENRDCQRNMQAQQGDLEHRIHRQRCAEAGAEQHKNGEGAKPVNGDGNAAVAVRTAFHLRCELQSGAPKAWAETMLLFKRLRTLVESENSAALMEPLYC